MSRTIAHISFQITGNNGHIYPSSLILRETYNDYFLQLVLMQVGNEGIVWQDSFSCLNDALKSFDNVMDDAEVLNDIRNVEVISSPERKGERSITF